MRKQNSVSSSDSVTKVAVDVITLSDKCSKNLSKLPNNNSTQANGSKTTMTTATWSPSGVHSSSGNFFRRFWSMKSSMEKLYIIAIVTLLLLTFLFVALTGYFVDEFRKLKNEQSKMCLSKECVRSSSSILDRMDFLVDPCENFYDFSCGNYLKSRSVPDDQLSRTILQEIQDELYIEMRHHLESSSKNDPESIKKAKLFYSSCMNESTFDDESESIRLINGLISDGGFWSLLKQLEELIAGDNEVGSGSSSSSASSSGDTSSSSESRKIDLEKRIANAYMNQVQSIFHFFVAPQEKNSTNYAFHLFNGNTVLETVYLLNATNNPSEYGSYATSYNDLIFNVLYLLAHGTTNTNSSTTISFSSSSSDTVITAEEKAKLFSKLESKLMDMFAFEADLANLTKLSADNINGSSNSNENENDGTSSEDISKHSPSIRVSIEELDEEYNFLNWNKIFEYLNESTGTYIDEILIDSKEYLHEMKLLFGRHSKETIDNYFCWGTLARFLPYLGSNFRRLYLDFRREIPDLSESGNSESTTNRVFLSRWKECVHLTCEGLKLPSSLLYLNHHKEFMITINDTVNDMVHRIKDSFYELIKEQSWLKSKEIEQYLMKRASSIGAKIGFPSYVFNSTESELLYSNLNIQSSDVFVSNIIKIAQNEMRMDLKKLNETIDPDRDWLIQPLVSNAYFDSTNDYIILPAGILRYPLVGSNRPKFLDYSTLGVVIGHEIAHSFDILARREHETNMDMYNLDTLDSNVTSWWLNSELSTKYESMTKCFSDQFSNFTIDRIGEHLNGNATLAENLCDFSGFQQSFRAYQKLRHTRKEKFSQILPGLENFTPDQLFFIQYAQVWCEVSTEEGDRKSVIDDHSPGRFRTYGVVTNSPQFGKLFKCKPGTPMNPIDKCTLWAPKS